MGKRIVIAGAGGFGRGVYSWIKTSPRHLDYHGISEIVFIDDDEPSVPTPVRVVSTIREYTPEVNDLLLCAIGVPAIRLAVVDVLKRAGGRFHTFIDDRAVVGSGVSIGLGSIICPGVVISANAKVGEQVHINFNCSVGHDTQIGRATTLSPLVNIMGEVRVGDAVFFGGSAVVLPRITVGDRVTIGAGTVVINSTSAEQTIVGNPARIIFKERESK